MGGSGSPFVSALDANQRLILCVLLQALAERDERFVRARRKHKTQLVADAEYFCRTEGFDEMAELCGVSPDLLRGRSPEDAFVALKKLRPLED